MEWKRLTSFSVATFVKLSIVEISSGFIASFAASFLIDQHPWMIISSSCLCLSFAIFLATGYIEKIPDPKKAAIEDVFADHSTDQPSGGGLFSEGRLLLLLTFVITVPGISFEDIKLQYMKSRFEQTWSAVS